MLLGDGHRLDPSDSFLVGRNFPDCRALILAHHGMGHPVDGLMHAWHTAYDAIVATRASRSSLAH
jgi:hypothetical protein